MSYRHDEAETWACGCYANNGRNIHHDRDCAYCAECPPNND